MNMSDKLSKYSEPTYTPVAVGAVLLAFVYLVAYCALVTPDGTLLQERATGIYDIDTITISRYRCGDNIGRVFFPVEWIDRQLRHERWSRWGVDYDFNVD